MSKNMTVTVVCGGDNVTINGKTDGFTWYTFSESRNEETFYSQKISDYFFNILENEWPDIIHIWGSEYPHTLEMIDAAIKVGFIDRVVVSIQGLVSSCSFKYTSGLPYRTISHKTVFDTIRSTSIKDNAEAFFWRGVYETEALSKIRHCIGRTDWDYHSVIAINQDIQYHKCNETLRNCFYSGSWNYQYCERCSIFVSQATYPIKGFHFLLQALPTILNYYPETHVYVSGADITKTKKIVDFMKLSSYGKYLGSLIKQNNLQRHVIFLGRLDDERMKQQYLKANVFVSCSSIENSPNSVGEAMLLGTPVISSDVGGVRGILSAPEEGILYQWDSAEALAEAVIDVFNNPEKAMARAVRARNHAQKTHDAEKNFRELMGIYEKIYAESQ